MCYHPVDAWCHLETGDITHNHHLASAHPYYWQYKPHACGYCIACRVTHSLGLAARCMHESLYHERSIFLTLTYDDEHLPLDRGLHYDDVQDFLRRLRLVSPTPFRFLCAGEYGELLERPHWHLLLFGYEPKMSYTYKTSSAGNQYWNSFETSEAWRNRGFAVHATVCPETCNYTARYSLKKLNTDSSYYISSGRRPPFMKCSLKPGLGTHYVNDYADQLFEQAHIGFDGKKIPIPRFYKEKLFLIDEYKYANMINKQVDFAAEHQLTENQQAARELIALRQYDSTLRSLE